MQSKEIEEFAKLARDYCEFIETAENIHADDLVARLALALPNLYGAAQLLPAVECTEDHEPGGGAKSDLDEYWRIHGWIAESLGEKNYYWEVFNPFVEDKPVCGSLADDLVDLYGELRRGLAVFDSGKANATVNGIWEWRFGLKYHWGDHLVDALRALHRLQAQRLINE